MTVLYTKALQMSSVIGYFCKKNVCVSVTDPIVLTIYNEILFRNLCGFRSHSEDIFWPT